MLQLTRGQEGWDLLQSGGVGENGATSECSVGWLNRWCGNARTIALSPPSLSPPSLSPPLSSVLPWERALKPRVETIIELCYHRTF